jgi:hypothetical protein
MYFEYAVRIDVAPDWDESRISDWFDSLPDATGFCMFEFADWEKEENPHVHAYVRTTLTGQNLRNKIRRLEWKSGVGNGSYSLKVCTDLAKYSAYCCKSSSRDEVPVIVWLSGWAFTEDWTRQKHVEYWKVNDSVRPVVTKGSAVSLLLEKCKEARVQWDDKTRIAEYYINLQISRNKPISIHAARAVCHTVSCLLAPDSSAVKELAVLIFPPDIPYNFV